MSAQARLLRLWATCCDSMHVERSSHHLGGGPLVRELVLFPNGARVRFTLANYGGEDQKELSLHLKHSTLTALLNASQFAKCAVQWDQRNASQETLWTLDAIEKAYQ